MLFNSYFFIFIFLPIALTGYFQFLRYRFHRLALSFLLLASLFFYAYWDYRFLILLTGSILFNFAAGYFIEWFSTKNRKKIVLLTATACNLALLFYYKYFDFYLEFLNFFVDHQQNFESSVLPLGISFFTFTQQAYLIDLYHNKARSSGFISYALFVTVFPHLIAGPILHHKEMTSQFNAKESLAWSTGNFSKGIFLFVIGLGKKVLIADYLALLVAPGFQIGLDPLPFFHAWAVAISYTLQLYFDFSGYSDMAIGLGLMFNLHLPINFNSPYQANSMIDFWRRWHISLSIFLRDYLYIPLGGSKNGSVAKMRNLFLTMLLGGIWHGAGWTYLLWGVCHGVLLMINHFWRSLNFSLNNGVCRALTLFSIVITWVIFRSPTVEVALHVFKGMSGGYGIVMPLAFKSFFAFFSGWGVQFLHLDHLLFRGRDLIILFLLSILVLFFPNSAYWKEVFHRSHYSPFICAVLFVTVLLNLRQISEFLYYQF